MFTFLIVFPIIAANQLLVFHPKLGMKEFIQKYGFLYKRINLNNKLKILYAPW